MSDSQPATVPFAAQAVPFQEMLATGKIPDGLITSPYVAEQFVERLVHYVLSVPAGSYSIANLGKLLEQARAGGPAATSILFQEVEGDEPRQSDALRTTVLRFHVRVQRTPFHLASRFEISSRSAYTAEPMLSSVDGFQRHAASNDELEPSAQPGPTAMQA